MFIITETSTGQVLRATHDETIAKRYVGNAVYRVLVS